MSAKIAVYSPDEKILERFLEVTPEGTEVDWVNSVDPDDKIVEGLSGKVAVILAGTSDFPVHLARRCPELSLIQTVSAGTDKLDKQALGEMGIRVANNGGGNAVAVAEHTIALMIGVYRKLHLQFRNVHNREWRGGIRDDWFSEAHELTGKTIGFVGLGQIGLRVARRLQGWECDLVYNDLAEIDAKIEQELGLRKMSVDQLLRCSDVVTLHVPLNEHTRGMISEREFGIMKSSAILINACRGPVVDEMALIRAMQQGTIAGAGLDVLEEEPTPVDNPLLEMENVLITPHLAAFSQEAGEKSRIFAIINAAQLLAGEEPNSVVLPV